MRFMKTDFTEKSEYGAAHPATRAGTWCSAGPYQVRYCFFAFKEREEGKKEMKELRRLPSRPERYATHCFTRQRSTLRGNVLFGKLFSGMIPASGAVRCCMSPAYMTRWPFFGGCPGRTTCGFPQYHRQRVLTWFPVAEPKTIPLCVSRFYLKPASSRCRCKNSPANAVLDSDIEPNRVRWALPVSP